MTAGNSLPKTSPGARLRGAYADRAIAVPGVFNALVARQAEEAGFKALYQSGAALSASLSATPDVGLLTVTEFAQQGKYLAEAVNIPVFSDADTGFGEALAVERTVREFESAGLAGLHLEDQRLPKRCGHLSGKELVSTTEMVAKIKAAVASRRDPDFVIIARTDARASEGLPAAVDRAKAYLDAGADVIFPEALQSAEEFRQFGTDLRAPMLANMTEFGKSPLLSVAELEEWGYRLILFPVTIMRVAMQATKQALETLAREGSQQLFLDQMQTRAQLYELLRYDSYDQRDQSYFGKKN
ncbi:MAG: methylisocitrate lyase [Planctomycetales bacterium]